MPVRVVRIGSPREPDEGLRIGTVRHPPRGVRKENYASGDYYDVWLPELAPSADLVSWLHGAPITPKRWEAYERRYRSQMARPPAQRLIRLLAALSRGTNFSIACYCRDEDRCHRSILRELLLQEGAEVL